MRGSSLFGVTVLAGLGATIATAAILLPLNLRVGGAGGSRSATATEGNVAIPGQQHGNQHGGGVPAPFADGAARRQSHVGAVDRATVAQPTPQAAAPLGGMQPWAAQVIPAPQQAARRSGPRPMDDERRAKLVRDIQTELERVGCYGADIDGDWGGTSKRAMAVFLQRVNASLPIDQPDYVLLSLVQAHRGLACVGDCVEGQALDANGRCIPQAVLAQAPKSSGPTASGLSAVAALGAAASNRVIETGSISARPTHPAAADRGASSVGDEIVPPRPVQVTRARAAEPVERDGSTTTTSTSEISVAAASAAAATVAVATASDRWSGRSALGAPMAQPPAAVAPQQPVTVRPQPDSAKSATKSRPRIVNERPAPPRRVSSQRRDASARQRRLVYDMFQRPDRN
jgi:hypothetical protein